MAFSNGSCMSTECIAMEIKLNALGKSAVNVNYSLIRSLVLRLVRSIW